MCLEAQTSRGCEYFLPFFQSLSYDQDIAVSVDQRNFGANSLGQVMAPSLLYLNHSKYNLCRCVMIYDKTNTTYIFMFFTFFFSNSCEAFRVNSTNADWKIFRLFKNVSQFCRFILQIFRKQKLFSPLGQGNNETCQKTSCFFTQVPIKVTLRSVWFSKECLMRRATESSKKK